jgi:hypothetical protein
LAGEYKAAGKLAEPTKGLAGEYKAAGKLKTTNPEGEYKGFFSLWLSALIKAL